MEMRPDTRARRGLRSGHRHTWRRLQPAPRASEGDMRIAEIFDPAAPPTEPRRRDGNRPRTFGSPDRTQSAAPSRSAKGKECRSESRAKDPAWRCLCKKKDRRIQTGWAYRELLAKDWPNRTTHVLFVVRRRVEGCRERSTVARFPAHRATARTVESKFAVHRMSMAAGPTLWRCDIPAARDAPQAYCSGNENSRKGER